MFDNSQVKSKRTLIYAGIVLLVIVVGVIAYIMLNNNHDGSELYIAKEVKVSTNSIELNKDESKTFTITITGAAGLIGVKSNDDSLLTISTDNADCNELRCFVDAYTGSEVKIDYTVKGLKSGNGKISVELLDLTSYEENTITGTGTINVSVK